MDGIPAEIFKSAGPVALEALHSLLTSIWDEENVPKEFRNTTFVSLFKNRSSKTDCGNYRGISLLSVAGKILARVVLNRLITNISEENLPEAQCRFRLKRNTTDMISVRQVQEKCIRTEYGPSCCLHRPDESLRHGQQRGPLGDSVEAEVPDQIREPDSPVPRRHDRTGTFRR